MRARRNRLFTLIFAGVAIAGMVALLQHQSGTPSIAGRFSVVYALFLIVYAVVTGLIGVLIFRFGRPAFYLLLANVLFSTVCLVAIEVAGQIYALVHPGYRVLAWEPHPVMGWKLVPNLSATWTGLHWYAREFSVAIETNSRGFRDVEREVAKPRNVVRIAVLGDSLVEALQVPLHKSATQILEQRLNAEPRGDNSHTPYEVLNFGVSSYGLGQFLLAWEHEVRQFRPDVVFVLIAGFQFERTVNRYATGAFPKTRERRLWIRPTFRIADDVLVPEPAKDYEEFQRLQSEVIATELRGRRVVRRAPKLFTIQLGMILRSTLHELSQRVLGRPDWRAGTDTMAAATAAVNLKVVEELAASVQRAGAELVVMGLGRTMTDGAILTQAVRETCAARGCAYLNLGKELSSADQQGIPPHWPHDGHFNQAGNEIFAAVMYQWVHGWKNAGRKESMRDR